MDNRLTEQAVRNNIADTLRSNLDDGPCLDWGLDEYFEMWGDGGFPWVEGGVLTLHPNSAISEQERRALVPLVDLLNAARKHTEGATPEDFLGSAWPSRIRSLAAEAYAIMVERGRFSEAKEEGEPSCRF